jgi:DNA-binding winged helix-turn-helix (wHTH) protein/Tol biopolymer transport system component
MSSAELSVSGAPPRKPIVAFGPFTFDPNNHLLRRGAEELAVPPRVLGVLDVLLQRHGDLVPRQELIEHVWREAFVTDTSLAEAVSLLRQALGDDPQSATYIQTVHRRGYRFVAPVEHRPNDRPTAAPLTAVAQSGGVSPSIGGHLVPWSIAALCTTLALAAVWQMTARREPAPVTARFSVQLSGALHFDEHGAAVALSPDGARAVWSACDASGCRLYVRRLDTLEPQAVPGTEDASSPFFSPDGGWIGFFAAGKLKKVALAGGSPAMVADVTQPRGAAWSQDGTIVFGGSSAGGLFRVSASGGVPEKLTTPSQDRGEVRHGWPALSPDGRTLFFTIDTMLEPEDAPGRLAAAALDRTPVTAWTTFLNGAGMARPIALDLLLVSRGSELQAVTFDPLRRTIVGVPHTIAAAVATTRGRPQFAAAPVGALIFGQPGESASASGLAWWTSAGMSPSTEGLRDVGPAPALSPDAQRLAWASASGDDRSNVWLGDLRRGAVTRLTHEGASASPVWSADGRRVFFSTKRDGIFRLAAIDADGGEPALMPTARGHAFPASASSDGQQLAFVEMNRDTGADVWTISTAGKSPRPVADSSFDETSPAFSPTAALLAYQSDAGGRWDVYVHRLTDGRRVVVSTNGGERPFWSRDGRSLFYQSGVRLMRASVSADDLRVGVPVGVAETLPGWPIGEAPDGRLLLRLPRAGPSTSAVVVLHGDLEARRLLGPPTTTMPR